MNVRTIFIAGAAALAMMAGGSTLAASNAQDQQGGYGMMQRGQGPGPWWMAGAGPDAGTENGWPGMQRGMWGGMWGGPWMHGYGMMGLMGGCPTMMGPELDRKTAMRMRGEMMRAMGEILIKYADQVEAPATKP